MTRTAEPGEDPRGGYGSWRALRYEYEDSSSSTDESEEIDLELGEPCLTTTGLRERPWSGPERRSAISASARRRVKMPNAEPC